MEHSDFLADDFTVEVKAAIAEAIQDTLAAGVSIFYRDARAAIDVMEQPDGRKFEIRLTANAPCHQNYEVVREIGKTAA